MAGLYIHIPFCRRKCYYCDFYSIGARCAPWQQYADALAAEARARAQEWRAIVPSDAHHTIYIGGGTPSQMPVQMISALIGELRDILGIRHTSECTVEVNPEDVTGTMAKALRESGVDRVSMGLQSLCDEELQLIGRRHTAQRGIEAYRILSEVFDNISLDLMFSLPTQTLYSWERTLEQTISLKPAHISAYSLMWEEGAALLRMREMGRVQECDEELALSMYRALSERLTQAGYEHYEISNYAMPSRHSIHNSSYWAGTPYMGLGPGAHSYDGGRIRRSNPPDLPGYLAHFSGDNSRDEDTTAGAFAQVEILTATELNEEYILTRLRTRAGIEVADYRERFGTAAAERLLGRATKLRDLLRVSEQEIRLSSEGVMRSDAAILALI